MSTLILFMLPTVVITIAFVLAYSRTDRYPGYAKGGEVPPQNHEGVRVKLSDGWQGFQAFCQCPKCGKHDLHTLDTPSDYEPVLVNEHTFRMWGGQAVMLNHLEYDREDERDWEIARVCVSCKHRFGQR